MTAVSAESQNWNTSLLKKELSTNPLIHQILMLLKTLIVSISSAFLIANGVTNSAFNVIFTFTKTTKSEIVVIKDLNANVKPYVYFNLGTGKEVPASDAE